MIGFLRQIGRGIDAGKLFEIVDEVRLIEITTVGRNVYPGKVCAGANLLQDLLKAPDASKEFRRKPNFIGEKLDKPARADADVVGKIGHGRSSMNIAKKPQSTIDCAMPLQRLERLFKQAFFKHLQFLLRRLRL